MQLRSKRPADGGAARDHEYCAAPRVDIASSGRYGYVASAASRILSQFPPNLPLLKLLPALRACEGYGTVATANPRGGLSKRPKPPASHSILPIFLRPRRFPSRRAAGRDRRIFFLINRRFVAARTGSEKRAVDPEHQYLEFAFKSCK